MPEDREEKTEPATPRRREESRKKGQVAKSVEVNSALILIIIISLLRYLGPIIFRRLYEFTQFVFQNLGSFSFSYQNVPTYLIGILLFMAKIVAPIMGIAFIIGLSANLFQVGFVLSIFPITPNLERINPVSGFSRILSSRSIVELVKSLLKVFIVGYVSYVTIRSEFNSFVPMMTMDISVSAAAVAILSYKIAIRIALILLILALFDYGYQRFEFEKSIRMSKKEIKDEYKQLEGDPLLRARIRQRQREITRRRMMQEVPQADVVITNPTHLAVALRYEAVKMKAPQVVAKGARLIAEKIKEIAEEYHVPIVENPPLAQALYKSCEVGQEVPANLYQAVAEILAFVYSLSGKKAAAVG